MNIKELNNNVNHRRANPVNRWLKNTQSWLFPPVCVLCGSHGSTGFDLCDGCAADLPFITTACLRCGIPLPMAGTCGHCQQHLPAQSRASALFYYQPPVDALIKQLKFANKLQMATLLGGLMAEHLAARCISNLPEVIVPVPLHPQRLRERGFNQALELARPLARRLKLPLDWRSVTRTRMTATQSDLPAKLRQRNVKGAFIVTPTLAGRHVAIVDDVMTTGHTVNELAMALREAGAREITVWVCARAITAG